MKDNHVPEGTLQAYLDDQLAASEHAQVEAHLAHCPRCADTLQAQQARAAETRRVMAELPASAEPLTILQAKARYTAYRRTREMEHTNMSRNIFSRYRTAWMAAALVLILAVAFAFPQVRAIANSFLGLFRVQQITLVQVDQALPEQLSQSAQMELLFSEDVQFDQLGEPQTVTSAAAASELVGFAVRQPQGVEVRPEYLVTPAGKVKFIVDLDKLHAILDEMGRGDLRLPPAVDGAELVAQIEAGVSLSFGPCIEMQGDPDDPETVYYRDCTTLLQVPSPSVEAPPGLDVRQIGEVYMQFLGMSAEDAAAFSRQVDWANTLVVPIPSYSMNYQQVAVDGVTGTFLSPRSPQPGQMYLLFWMKDGLLYALNGEGSLSDAQAVVESLK